MKKIILLLGLLVVGFGYSAEVKADILWSKI